MIGKYLTFIAIIFLIIACGGDEESAFECTSGATLLLGESNNQCGTMSRFSHNVRLDEETYSLFLDYPPYGNGNLVLSPRAILEEGTTYQFANGAAYSSALLGGINRFDVTILKLDRVNQTMDITFDLDATVLSNNTRFEMFGKLTDLPLTENIN